MYIVRNPKHVEGIDAPDFSKLPKKLKDWLSSAQMIAPKKEDADLVGKAGAELYDALGSERKAAVLNIFAKATHTGTVGDIWTFIQSPLVFRRDRCFVRIDDAIREHVRSDGPARSS